MANFLQWNQTQFSPSYAITQLFVHIETIKHHYIDKCAVMPQTVCACVRFFLISLEIYVEKGKNAPNEK